MADCPDEFFPLFNITSQADIEDSTFSQFRCFDGISVHGAKGSLNFTNVQLVFDLEVLNSPELQNLIFPKLIYVKNFSVGNARSLVNILMPLLTLSDDGLPAPYSFNITDAPALQNIDYGNVSRINFFTLTGTGGTIMSNVTELYYLETDLSVSFPDLTWAETVKLNFTSPLPLADADITDRLPKLTDFFDYTLEDGHDLSSEYRNPIYYTDMVNGSLVIQSLEYRENEVISSDDSPPPFANSLDFSTTAIGKSAYIHSNTNVHIGLDVLVTVGSDFSFVNNTNCSLNMNQLSKVGDLIIIDNILTTITILPNLKTANNIHLRGNIDTTAGINIFPALSLVPGSVTIEAWNSDFNCSKLVAQYRDSVIHNFSCNGTDNSTVPTLYTLPTASTQPTNPSHGLSDGAWAGIGVGIGAIVLGSIIALAWLFLHYHRRQQDKSVDNESSGAPEKENEVYPPDLSGLREAEDSRIIREAPDGAVHEMPVPPAEKPDDHLREMMALPGELPASSSAYDEIGDREGM